MTRHTGNLTNPMKSKQSEEAEKLTSEQAHGIVAQPPPGRPLIDAAIAGAERVLSKIKRYEKTDEVKELHDMLWEVEYTVNDFCGRNNKLDEIRHRLEEVRAWGEEWKQYALSLSTLNPPTK